MLPQKTRSDATCFVRNLHSLSVLFLTDFPSVNGYE